MTKAGKLEIRLNAFMKQVEARLAALESTNKPEKTKKSVKKDEGEIVLEVKNDNIVASDAE